MVRDLSVLYDNMLSSEVLLDFLSGAWLIFIFGHDFKNRLVRVCDKKWFPVHAVVLDGLVEVHQGLKQLPILSFLSEWWIQKAIKSWTTNVHACVPLSQIVFHPRWILLTVMVLLVWALIDPLRGWSSCDRSKIFCASKIWIWKLIVTHEKFGI